MTDPQTSMYAFVMRELEATKGTWPEIAEATGIALSTLKKIGYRHTRDPGVSFVEKLANHFRQRQQRPRKTARLGARSML